jgi:hypothetical protein
MKADRDYVNPEPVPHASQLAVLPFIAGIRGFLRGGGSDLRVVMHRAMSREGKGYLQQVCKDVGPTESDPNAGVGRLWHRNYGIIGMAYGKRAISRTKKFPDEASLRAALEKDKRSVGDTEPIKQLSWLAIPFLSARGEPVLILFVDSFKLNFFSDDFRIKAVVDMCHGFCELIDGLEAHPFPRLRNFPLKPGAMVEGPPTVYSSVQEELVSWSVPQFHKLESFNYDAL